MKATQAGIINLIGRILLASVFLLTALVNKIPDFHHVAEQMAHEGVPFPRVMLVGAIVFLLAGSLSGSRRGLGQCFFWSSPSPAPISFIISGHTRSQDKYRSTSCLL